MSDEISNGAAVGSAELFCSIVRKAADELVLSASYGRAGDVKGAIAHLKVAQTILSEVTKPNAAPLSERACER